MSRTTLRIIALGMMLAVTVIWPAANFNTGTQAQSPQPGPDKAWWAEGGAAYKSRPPEYKAARRSSLYLPMRDGVRLAIDVYLPEDLPPGAKLPTILEQTRYWRWFEFKPEFKQFDKTRGDILQYVTRGYAYVNVDTRGSGASFGHRKAELSPDEVRDGKDVVDWIIKQPWSDGKVGATGNSYSGVTAQLLAVNMHPAVKAVIPRFSPYDSYLDITHPGGILNEWFAKAWSDLDAALDRNQPPTQMGGYFLGARPVDGDEDKKLLAAAVKEHAANAPVERDLSSIVFRDDRATGGWVFSDISPSGYVAEQKKSGTAIYNYTGWYDGGYAQAAIDSYLQIGNPGSRMILGPWSHGGMYYLNRPPAFDHQTEWLRFFDHHLKGIANGIEKEPPIHYYAQREEKWKASFAWPLPQTRVEAWYFGDRNELGRNRPAANADTYKVDPTAGSTNQTRWDTLLSARMDIYADRARQDEKLLTYTSSPLAEDVEITGHPVVTLHVSSTAADGNFVVYLELIDEEGKISQITEGHLRAIHRKLGKSAHADRLGIPFHSFLRRDALPLAPGKMAEIKFALIPTSTLARKGQHIRVAIAGADKDHLRLAPEEPPTLKLHRGGTSASRIDLPVIPRPGV